MKTAEEILDEYGCPDIPYDEWVKMYYPAIINAMEEYANQSKLQVPSEKEAIEIISEGLRKCFAMGLKQHPNDADNSEFYAPMMELNIAPKILEKLKSHLSEQIPYSECQSSNDYKVSSEQPKEEGNDLEYHMLELLNLINNYHTKEGYDLIDLRHVAEYLSYLEQQRCKRCNRIAPLKDGLCYGCKCLTD